MDLNHVAAFVRVAQDGSFTAAAKALAVPKSSVSRGVAQLERELGIRLIHRTTRQLHLTEAGRAYYTRVSRALHDVHDAARQAAEDQTELRGVVRVTAPVDIGVWALARMVRKFVRKHPKIHVEVSLSGRVVDLVGEGFDLAVRAGPLRDSSLVARRIGEPPSAAYAVARYIARHGKPESVTELAKHNCILFRSSGTSATWVLSLRR